MIFEILGAIHLIDGLSNSQRASIENGLSTYPWSKLSSETRHRQKDKTTHVVYFERSERFSAVTADNDLSLLVIGEAFLRHDAGLPGAGERVSSDRMLDAFRLGGLESIKLFKGNFYLLVINNAQRTVDLISNRSSMLPFFYCLQGGTFYFSTSLGELGLALPTLPPVDNAAVIETVLFNFPMWERTFLTDVNRVDQATHYHLQNGKVTANKYWSPKQLYAADLMPEQEALETGFTLFSRSVNDLAADKQQICASFTSGFDSRVLHSVLQKDPKDVMAYSFGIKGSVNISIPKKICSDLGIQFQPLYLDGYYEEHFDEYAMQSIILSDGIVIQRANYPYAFEQLSQFSDTVLTGMFGSELLRTFQNLDTVMTSHFTHINSAPDHMAALEEILVSINNSEYLSHDILTASALDDVRADISHWYNAFGDADIDKRVYLYLLSEVDRKFFASEISTERIYAMNRAPFMDDEFVELLFRAPFAGVHSHALKPSIQNRFSSQNFYTYIINKNRPALLKYYTDHGYPPRDLLRPFPLLFVGTKHLLFRVYKRMINYDEFRPRQWMENLYSKKYKPLSLANEIASPQFKVELENGQFLDNLDEFNKIGAISLWLSNLRDGYIV